MPPGLAQLAYDSAFFAFEGQWTYQTNSTLITPIGVLQQQARAFSIANGGNLGVHVPAVALMLDFQGGWTRPCDTQPKVGYCHRGRQCMSAAVRVARVYRTRTPAMQTYSPLQTRVPLNVDWYSTTTPLRGVTFPGMLLISSQTQARIEFRRP